MAVNFPVPNAQPPSYDRSEHIIDGPFARSPDTAGGGHGYNDGHHQGTPISAAPSYPPTISVTRDDDYGYGEAAREQQDLHGAPYGASTQDGYAPLQQNERAHYEDPFHPAWQQQQEQQGPWDMRPSMDNQGMHDLERYPQGRGASAIEMNSLSKGDDWDSGVAGTVDRSRPHNPAAAPPLHDQIMFALGMDRIMRLFHIKKGVPLDDANARKRRGLGGQTYTPMVWLLTASECGWR